MSPPRFVLTLITPQPLDLGRLREALEGAPEGAVAVQLRQADAAERHRLAEPVLELCRARGAPLIVNADLGLAAALGADGVQLPERGPSLDEARAALGDDVWLGVSRHDAEGLARASEASFALVSPVFAVPGKGAPLGVDGFARTVAAARTPVHALGGVDARHGAALRAAGAAGLAVIRAVFDADAPAEAARALVAPFLEPPPDGGATR